MNSIPLTILFVMVLLVTGCANLSREEEVRYHAELANVNDLDRAVEIFKVAEWQSPLEKKAREKTILILRNKELPKAKTADDYIALLDRLCWGMASIRNDILLYAILNLDDIGEIKKILHFTTGGNQRLWQIGMARIKRIEDENRE